MADFPKTSAERVERELLAMLGRWWAVGDKLPPTPELARRLGTGHRSTHAALGSLARKGYLISKPGLGTYVLRGAEGKASAPLDPAKSTAETAPVPRIDGSRIGLLINRNAAIGNAANFMSDTLGRAGASVRLIEADGTCNDAR